MSVALNKQHGFSMVEVLLAVILLVMIVTTLAGYHRVQANRFITLNQYREIWHQAWNQTQLSATGMPEGWQVIRLQTTTAGCVSIKVTVISPLGRQGHMTRLHCPVSQ